MPHELGAIVHDYLGVIMVYFNWKSLRPSRVRSNSAA